MRITLPEPQKFIETFHSITNETLDPHITGITTDSRDCRAGDLYIAILGEHVDGHNYVDDAYHNGAVTALVSSEYNVDSKIQQIVVKDPVDTIGKVANKWRRQFNIPVIGITGSNGKTTTKELIRQIFTEEYFVHATKGNFNTSIGLPLTLLRMQSKHTISILEMGANKTGDIKTLCQIAEPTDGLITNIAPAHLEGFGSIKQIAKEKAELFNYLTSGKAFINVSDKWVATFKTQTASVSFGCEADCDYAADYYREDNGNIILIINANELNLKSANIIFAKNVLAAATVANSFGIDWATIQDKILSFSPAKGRSTITKYGDVTVIDDTYNANYTSTVAAIDYLTSYFNGDRRIFVFGDMFELGEFSKEHHTKIGEKCSEAHLDAVFTVGTETQFTEQALNGSIHHQYFTDKDELSSELKKYIKAKDIILFKGSRSMAMENIIKKVFNC